MNDKVIIYNRVSSKEQATSSKNMQEVNPVTISPQETTSKSSSSKIKDKKFTVKNFKAPTNGTGCTDYDISEIVRDINGRCGKKYTSTEILKALQKISKRKRTPKKEKGSSEYPGVKTFKDVIKKIEKREKKKKRKSSK